MAWISGQLSFIPASQIRYHPNHQPGYRTAVLVVALCLNPVIKSFMPVSRSASTYNSAVIAKEQLGNRKPQIIGQAGFSRSFLVLALARASEEARA